MIRNLLIFGCVSLTFATNVAAADDEDSFVNYDSIVSELKASAEEPIFIPDNNDWEEVAVHGGIGISTSYVGIQSPEGISGSGLMKGFAAHTGVNLFTRKARAELAFRNYAQESLDNNMEVNLREFELSLIFLPYLSAKSNLRMGGGLVARYMNLNVRSQGAWYSHDASTPATSLLLGLEHKISKQVSVGPDLAYRSAMVVDTFDKSSWDASFRLNATF